MTARDLVVHMGELRGLPRRVAVLRASEVLFQVGLEEERSRLIRTFSVGMRQRTNLAQAIVHSPELVILDEPTNGLDPAGREEMLTLVRRLSSDLGIAVRDVVARARGRRPHVRRGGGAARGHAGGVARDRPRRQAAESAELRVRVSGDRQAFRTALERARASRCASDEDHLLAARRGSRPPRSTRCATRPPSPASGCAS